MVAGAVLKWHEVNGALPMRVLIYRDGCGDGQVPFVRKTEVNLVKKAFDKAAARLQMNDYSPALAFTIVTKRVRGKVPEGKYREGGLR